MSEIKNYIEAMKRGDHNRCVEIEQRHGLYGYPPELVSIGLKSLDDGDDPHEAIDAHLYPWIRS